MLLFFPLVNHTSGSPLIALEEDECEFKQGDLDHDGTPYQFGDTIKMVYCILELEEDICEGDYTCDDCVDLFDAMGYSIGFNEFNNGG